MRVKFNNEEIKIINEVKEDIKNKYCKQANIKFEIFEPLSPDWKSNFFFRGGYNWGYSRGFFYRFNKMP